MDSIILYGNDQENINNLVNMNEITKDKGLVLSQKEIMMLIENKNNTLKDIGRVEIGKSIIDDIIYIFYDSNYIDSSNYFDTINELINVFYMYQDKFSDYLVDEEIVKYMSDCFNEVGGSLELLSSVSFDELNTRILYGECDE